MTILKTAYESTACNGYQMTKTTDAILTAHAVGYLKESSVQDVFMVTPSASTVPVFNYPLVFENRDHTNWVAFDGRPYLSRVDTEEGFRVRNATEMDAKLLQAQLALQWFGGYQGRLRDMSLLGLAVYANWLGEVITKRFSLDARTQLQISVLAGVFYLNNFWDKNEATPEETSYLLSAITRATGFKHGDVIDLVETYPIITDLSHFCEVVKTHTQNVRLADFNPATLIGAVGGSWWGNTGREAIAVALEYPPVWYTLLFQAITDRSFKRAPLADVVNRNTYRRWTEDFFRQLAALTA